MGEVDGAQVRDGGEGEGGEGADRVVGQPQFTDPDVVHGRIKSQIRNINHFSTFSSGK